MERQVTLSCHNCGQEIERKYVLHANGKRYAESLKRYAARKFCSGACNIEYCKNNRLGWFANRTI